MWGKGGFSALGSQGMVQHIAKVIQCSLPKKSMIYLDYFGVEMEGVIESGICVVFVLFISSLNGHLKNGKYPNRFQQKWMVWRPGVS